MITFDYIELNKTLKFISFHFLSMQKLKPHMWSIPYFSALLYAILAY